MCRLHSTEIQNVIFHRIKNNTGNLKIIKPTLTRGNNLHNFPRRNVVMLINFNEAKSCVYSRSRNCVRVKMF